MDTAVWILIVALVVVVLAVIGFFIYKYYLEPNHIMDHIMHHDSHSASVSGSHHASQHSKTPEGSSSMAGHLIGKMKKAKAHSRKAVKKIGQAKQHLSKAQAHAATA